MSLFFNKKEIEPTRRKLRNNITSTENVLWLSLKKKQVLGVKFLRQYSVGPFIVDFYSPKIKLAIEADGETHFESDEAIQYDKRREKYIKELGVVFLRFKYERIFSNINLVVKQAKVKELLEQKTARNPL